MTVDLCSKTHEMACKDHFYRRLIDFTKLHILPHSSIEPGIIGFRMWRPYSRAHRGTLNFNVVNLRVYLYSSALASRLAENAGLSRQWICLVKHMKWPVKIISIGA